MATTERICEWCGTPFKATVELFNRQLVEQYVKGGDHVQPGRESRPSGASAGNP